MKISDELLKQFKDVKSAKDAADLAKKHGVDLDEETAEKYLVGNEKKGELNDEELNNVSGGAFEDSCDVSNNAKLYAVGDRVRYFDFSTNDPDETAHETKGVILAVSEYPQGMVYTEWVYTIKEDGGPETEVYEHQIKEKI